MKTSHFNAQWLDAIISIESVSAKGQTQPRGTGFLIRTENNHIVLVTASHVIRSQDGKVYEGLQYRRSDADDKDAVVSEKDLLKANTRDWFFSESHDVACRFFGWRSGQKGLTVIPMDSFLTVEDLQPGTPLLVLGYPAGLGRGFLEKPLARRGMVSRVEKDKIIAETFVFPGNSGGPVIYVPIMKFGKGISSSLVNEEKFVGVVSSFISYQEAAVSPQTGRTRIVFEENSGLSEVIPAEAVRQLLSRDDFKKQEESFGTKEQKDTPNQER